MENSTKRILVHTCCAPCLVYPAKVLRGEGYKISAYWYNPNIHGPREYEKRKMTLGYYLSSNKDIDYIPDIYNIKEWFASLKTYEDKKRCADCYRHRLERAAQKAVENNIDTFTTTLLYSKFQQHEMIKEIGADIAGAKKIKFYYKDFREGWKEGINMSKEMDLYRQEYCGCVFSASDRYNVS